MVTIQNVGCAVSDVIESLTMKKNTPTNARSQVNTPALAHAPDLRALLYGLQAVRDGDFSVRLPGDWIGLEGKIADTFNEIVAANQKMAQELQRVGQVVGKGCRASAIWYWPKPENEIGWLSSSTIMCRRF